MDGLSPAMKDRITEVLDSTRYTQQGFTVTYDDGNNPLATITVSSSPECRFVLSSTSEGAFTTSESPGIHSDMAETFPRGDFELCMKAIRDWVRRIIDRQNDWILDEFGGVADRDPSLSRKQ
jgi:hypothetical protein